MNKSTPIQLPLPVEGATVEIPLTKGYTAMVDAVDADLAEHKWYAMTSSTTPYAYRKQYPSRKCIGLHQVILERMLSRNLQQNEYPDHINGNGLDNSRGNIRLATKSKNAMNAKTSRRNKIGLKGVAPAKKKWGAFIKVKNKTIHLGTYDTPEEAHEAYKRAAIEHFGEFARFE
jgi:hypothetical protein